MDFEVKSADKSHMHIQIHVNRYFIETLVSLIINQLIQRWTKSRGEDATIPSFYFQKVTTNVL